MLGINAWGSPNHPLSVIHPQRTFLQGLTAGLSVEEKDQGSFVCTWNTTLFICPWLHFFYPRVQILWEYKRIFFLPKCQTISFPTREKMPCAHQIPAASLPSWLTPVWQPKMLWSDIHRGTVWGTKSTCKLCLHSDWLNKIRCVQSYIYFLVFFFRGLQTSICKFNQ